MNIIIRPAILTEDGDLHYILSSWLKTYREDGKFTRRIKPSVFYSEHERRIKKIIWDVEVYIACTEEDPDVILGYRVSDGDVFHWIFVRPEFRKNGVAKQLAGEFKWNKAHFTHWSIGCDSKINQMLETYPQMQFNPYLF